MKISVINGSHRKGNSLRISRYILEKLSEMPGCTSTALIDLSESPVPLWNEAAWEEGSSLDRQWQESAEILKASHGFVVVVPEWHGMVPSGLKNFFLYCSGKEVGHKPAFLCSVSAGTGGAYPIAELRMSSYKNNQICYLPEHVIIRSASSFPEDPKSKEKNVEMIERLDHGLRLLLIYSRALTTMREEASDYDFNRYPYGM